MPSPGYHEYKPFPGVDRCSICLGKDGDCLDSPAFKAKEDHSGDGRYLHSVEYPMIQVKIGEHLRPDPWPSDGEPPAYTSTYSEVNVFVPEDDFYEVQGERDEYRKLLGLIGMHAWSVPQHVRGSDPMAVIRRLLGEAGVTEVEAKALAGLIAAAKEGLSQ